MNTSQEGEEKEEGVSDAIISSLVSAPCCQGEQWQAAGVEKLTYLTIYIYIVYRFNQSLTKCAGTSFWIVPVTSAAGHNLKFGEAKINK